MRIGMPEVVMVFLVFIFWAIPIMAGVWALFTLHRLRVGQDELQRRMAAIERSLQGRVSG